MAKKKTKEDWVELIKAASEEAGTYQPFFDLVISELAGILETKTEAESQYKKNGGTPVIEYTNKGGYTNMRKNPALVIIQECNQQALAYWKELGLTSKSYNAMGNKIEKEKDAFSELLGGIL